MKMVLLSDPAVWAREQIEESLSEYMSMFGVNLIGFEQDGRTIRFHYTTTMLTAGLASNARMSVKAYVKQLLKEFQDTYHAV